ncbi:hypothetical protein B0H19DRAFT_1228756, partial [Mycena capillaripes]
MTKRAVAPSVLRPMASQPQNHRHPYAPGVVYGNPFIAVCNGSGCVHSDACPLSHISHYFAPYPSIPLANGGTVEAHDPPASHSAPKASPTCAFFLKNRCSQGENCRFSHIVSNPDTRSYMGPCKFFRQGLCRNGESCPFFHDSLEPPSSANANGRHDHEGTWEAPSEPMLASELNDQPFIMKEAEFHAASSPSTEPPTQLDLAASVHAAAPPVEGSLHTAAVVSAEASVFEPCLFHTTGRCVRGDSCSVSHDETAERIYSPIPSASPLLADLRGSDGDWIQFSEQAIAQASNYDPSSAPICTFFAQGLCKMGTHCRFRHELVDTLESPTTAQALRPCRYFALGTCRQGNACPYVHDIRAQPAAARASAVTENAPPKGQLCRNYSAGRCWRGDKCRFRHESDGWPQSPELAPAISDQGTGWLQNTDNWGTNTDNWGTGTDKWDTDTQDVSKWAAEDPVSEPQVNKSCKGRAESETASGWPQEIDDNEWTLEKKIENKWGAGKDSEDSGQNWLHQTDQNSDWNVDQQDTARRLSPSPVKDPGAEQSWNSPWPPAVPDVKPPPTANCKYFGQGHCFNGESCHFRHVREQDRDLDPVQQDVDGFQQEPPTQQDAASVPIPELEPEPVCRSGLSGAIPEEVVTSFDSLGLILSNYPAGIAHEDLVQLTEPYGAVKNTTFRLSPSGLQAHIEFEEHSQAAEARANLNGVTLDGLVMQAQLDSIGSVSGNIYEPEFGRQIKLIWDAPSVSAWAFSFVPSDPNVRAAKDESARLNGIMYGARKITAEYRTPSQHHSIPVRLCGLPPHVKRDELHHFCVGSSSVSLDTPNYQGSQNDNILRYLMEFGPVNFFEVLPTDPSHLKITGFAEFRREEAAVNVIRALKETRHDFLGKGRIAAQSVCYSKYDCSNCPFAVIRDDLDCLRDSSSESATIHYNQSCVHIYGRRASAVELIRKSVQDLLLGSEMTSWDPYFDTSSSEEAIKRINAETSFHVRQDRRRRVLIIWGNREKAAKQITRLLKQVQAKRHSVCVDESLMPALIRGGLQSLQEEFGPSKILLDVRGQTVTILGDFKTQVESHLNTLASPSWGDTGNCCLCLSDAVEPIELACAHIYCSECLKLLLRPVPGLDFTAPTCVAKVGGLCLAPIPTRILLSHLSDADRRQLLELSLLSFIRAEPEFRFCPSGCAVIYRLGTGGTVFTCPDCSLALCASCAVPAHTGLTCAEYETLTSTEGEERMVSRDGST